MTDIAGSQSREPGTAHPGAGGEGTLAGKVAVVTGAGRGIGRSEAMGLAREGAHVLVNDPGRDLGDPSVRSADTVVDEIRSQGLSAEASYDDISSWSGGEALISQAVAVNGRLDILVCNAGVERSRMLFNMTEDDWDTVTRVHLKGHFVPARFAARHWRTLSKRDGQPAGGRLIFTSSEAGLFGQVGHLGYVTAKAGILGMTLAASRELRKYGVTVNCISPRARTTMAMETLGSRILPPVESFDTWDPDNIGPWVAYLAGPHAASVSGQVFVVHGGTVGWLAGWSERGSVTSPQAWTTDRLATAAQAMFAGAETFPDPFPDLVEPAADEF
jgi:NAD(P)-dependent dehydrogenase (short-subunit alcohol dehydrogenase family)